VIRLQAYTILRKAHSPYLVEAIKLGMRDSYELLRRLSMITAAKSSDPAFLEMAAEMYFDPATSPREWFQLKYIMDQFSYDQIERIFTQYRGASPYWPSADDFATFLKNQKRGSDSREADMSKLFDESVAARSRKSAITTNRNLCQTEYLDKMLDYLKNGKTDELRLDIAETMGWYLYSWKVDEISAALKEQLSRETDPIIKNEIEKSLNRFKSQYNL